MIDSYNSVNKKFRNKSACSIKRIRMKDNTGTNSRNIQLLQTANNNLERNNPNILIEDNSQFDPNPSLIKLREKVVKFLENDDNSKLKAVDTNTNMNLFNLEEVDFKLNSRESVRNIGFNLVKTLDILTDNSLQPKFSDESKEFNKLKEGENIDKLSTNKMRPKTSILSRNKSRTPFYSQPNNKEVTNMSTKTWGVDNMTQTAKAQEKIIGQEFVSSKVIAKSSRESLIHPMFRRQWKKYKTKRKKFINNFNFPERNNGLIKISSLSTCNSAAVIRK